MKNKIFHKSGYLKKMSILFVEGRKDGTLINQKIKIFRNVEFWVDVFSRFN